MKYLFSTKLFQGKIIHLMEVDGDNIAVTEEAYKMKIFGVTIGKKAEAVFCDGTSLAELTNAIKIYEYLDEHQPNRNKDSKK